MRIIFRYLAMQDVVDFALATLHDRSPVGSGADQHPGLYRDSHKVFLSGHVVEDVSAWRPGDQINISNPVPYARKIEAGHGKMSVPGRVYEDTALIVAGRYGNQAAVKFTFVRRRAGLRLVLAADPARPAAFRQGAPGLAGQTAGARNPRSAVSASQAIRPG
jgi:hypothetical protein